MCLAGVRSSKEAGVAAAECRAREDWWGEGREATGPDQARSVGHGTTAFILRKAVA